MLGGRLARARALDAEYVPRSRTTLSAIAMIAAWMLVASSPASASSCPITGLPVTALGQGSMEGSITCLINEQRAAYGVGPVQPNPALRQAAVGHSSEMISLGYFEHTSPAGVTFVDRIVATGYARVARAWEVGENLAWGTGPLSTPQALVSSWMNSPPHRDNLLRARFREIGIAAVVGTPQSSRDTTGVTVSSEYGYRSFAKAKKKRKRGKGKARRARKH
jgi:uncharacterized protein YkwD